jgi:hypothetical protein
MGREVVSEGVSRMEQRYRAAALFLALSLGACGDSGTRTNSPSDANVDAGLGDNNIAMGDLPAVDHLNGLNELQNAGEPAPPTCATQPASGARLEGRRLSGRGHTMEIRNGMAGDAIIKVRDADTGRLMTSFFAARNSTARLTGIPDGNYTIQYAFGSALAEDCKSFVTLTAANEFPGPEAMVTERVQESGGTRIRTARLTYTLYPVPEGNTVPNPIDPSLFNRD